MVRARGRGRGHPLGQDRRLPRGLPLLLAVGPVRHRRAGHAVPRPRGAPRRRQGDGRHRRVGVLHRARGAGPDEKTMQRLEELVPAGAGGDGAQRGRVGGDPHRGAGHPPGQGRHPPLQPQPRDGPLVLPARRHHPRVGGAVRHLPPRPRAGHGAVLRRAARAWGRRSPSASSSSSSCARSSRPRCRSTSSTPGRAPR